MYTAHGGHRTVKTFVSARSNCDIGEWIAAAGAARYLSFDRGRHVLSVRPLCCNLISVTLKSIPRRVLPQGDGGRLR